jgi:hypothetical protein
VCCTVLTYCRTVSTVSKYCTVIKMRIGCTWSRNGEVPLVHMVWSWSWSRWNLWYDYCTVHRQTACKRTILRILCITLVCCGTGQVDFRVSSRKGWMRLYIADLELKHFDVPRGQLSYSNRRVSYVFHSRPCMVGRWWCTVLIPVWWCG